MKLTFTFSILFILSLSLVTSEPQQLQLRPRCTDDEAVEHPHHCHLMGMAASDPVHLASNLHKWAKNIGFVVDKSSQIDPRKQPTSSMAAKNKNKNKNKKNLRNLNSASLPTVAAHGMGDSCFNDGMQSITQRVSDHTGQYATCIPTGDNLHDDTLNGYFMSMDANVDIFAEKIQKDPNLSGGFNAFGFSQGNNVIRGYIARYNDPPVHTFISVNGVNAGIGAVPYCIPKFEAQSSSPMMKRKAMELDQNNRDELEVEGRICNALMEIASHKAYSDFSQTHSFQANYWRDPRPDEKENYKKYSQLAQVNNEGVVNNSTLNENYAKTQKFVWILATKDTIVWPKEGEQWGAPNSAAADPFADILPMKQTEWYTSDLFGLKSADEAGKNHFEHFVGDHLAFNMDLFDSWIEKYFL